jgi:hypothetical protein
MFVNSSLKMCWYGSVVYECYQVLGFPANEAKMSIAILGQSSCSSSHPCLACIAAKSEFHLYPNWMHGHDSSILALE